MVELPHGYTYSAHPVGCAAGVAALDILVKEDMVGRVRSLAPYFEQAVHSLKGHPHVLDIRNYGLAAGFTIAPVLGEPARRPFDIAMALLEERLLRPVWRRHDPASTSVHRRARRNRSADQRAGRCAQ
jgi:beta-alanine--pyruvate transaminase